MPTCYVIESNATVERPAWTAFSGDGLDCCQGGDLVLPQHMCFSLNKQQKVDFYPAGFSDRDCLATANDANNVRCPQRNWCPSERQPAVVTFLGDNSHPQWQCCGGGNTGGQSCNPATGHTFAGPLTQDSYDDIINDVHKLGIAAIVGIAVAAFAFLLFWGLVIFCCCCSRRARERRSRGKFVPLGKGRDLPGDNVVWNSNVHDAGHELHDGPMGGYAAPPPGPGPHGAPQYTVQGFR